MGVVVNVPVEAVGTVVIMTGYGDETTLKSLGFDSSKASEESHLIHGRWTRAPFISPFGPEVKFGPNRAGMTRKYEREARLGPLAG
ncbi:hypothetical protein TorRG33x02_289430 [Trema orientale]|uniref:Uncharacterized protein n=1 Tax=Trema orientale TaxID=63057 RepID=A0A2P5CCZ8_TREOI|nr:hypothetical protein TorRG33x02_289430 [Trema orientale]